MNTRHATLSILLTALAVALWGGGSIAWQSTQTPPASSGAVRIKTDVTAAQVFLDGQEVGKTPLTLPAVAAGKHQLTLVKEGYQDHTQGVAVSEGKQAAVFVVMKPHETPLPQLPISFPAHHRHVSDFCLGLLTVTAEGVEYKAKDGVHVFQLPFRAMRSVSRSMGAAVIVAVPGPYTTTVTAVGASEAAKDSISNLKGNAPNAKPEPEPAPFPLRIDADQGYSFLAYEERRQANTGEKGATLLSVHQRTKELFEVVYQLWTADLTARKKEKKTGQQQER